ERRAFQRHLVHHHLRHILQQPLLHRRAQQPIAGVRAHASRVGSGVALATARLPSHSAKNETSSPSRNSSITTYVSAEPSNAPENISAAACSACLCVW